MIHVCKVCKEVIPAKRVELGYADTCVKHSTTAKFTGHVVADQKSTTWLDVIRDPKVGQHIQKLSETRGK